MTSTHRASGSVKLPGTPKPWMNRAMMLLLRTPGVRRMFTGMFGIITVTGATSGRRYTTPVQFVRVDGGYVVLSQRHRVWWRNLRTVPTATLEVAGRKLSVVAVVAEHEEAVEPIAAVLRSAPRVAKFYDLALDADGEPERTGVEALAEHMVAIVLTPC